MTAPPARPRAGRQPAAVRARKTVARAATGGAGGEADAVAVADGGKMNGAMPLLATAGSCRRRVIRTRPDGTATGRAAVSPGCPARQKMSRKESLGVRKSRPSSSRRFRPMPSGPRPRSDPKPGRPTRMASDPAGGGGVGGAAGLGAAAVGARPAEAPMRLASRARGLATSMTSRCRPVTEAGRPQRLGRGRRPTDPRPSRATSRLAAAAGGGGDPAGRPARDAGRPRANAGNQQPEADRPRVAIGDAATIPAPPAAAAPILPQCRAATTRMTRGSSFSGSRMSPANRTPDRGPSPTTTC